MAHIALRLMRFIVLSSMLLFHVCDAAEADEHPTKSSGTIPVWQQTGAYMFGAELLGGYVWFMRIASDTERMSGTNFTSAVVKIAFLLHGPMQFLPYVALCAGWVDCNTGLLWAIHWTYAAVLALATPVLCALGDSRVVKSMKLPIFGCKGSALAMSYFYVITVLCASDQYLDNMTIVIAFSCGWRLAWCMCLVMFVGLFVQAVAAYAVTRDPLSVIMALVGSLPDAQEARDTADALFAASQGVSKFFSENVPQALLAIKFALEVKPSNTVWFSVGASLILGGKACLKGLAYFCQGQISEYSAVQVAPQ